MNLNSVIDIVVGTAPLVFIGLFALPTYFGLLRHRGWVRGLVIIAVLGFFTLAYQLLAIKSGFLYQEFAYDLVLGPKLFGITPWVLAIIYPPILLSAFWLAHKFGQGARRILLTAVFFVCIDLVLETAAVKLEFWQWENPGPFYGVPLVTFLSWFAFGLIGALLLGRLWGEDDTAHALVAYSGLGVVLFWTGVSLGVEQWLPAAIGAVEAAILVTFVVTEKRRRRRAKTESSLPSQENILKP